MSQSSSSEKFYLDLRGTPCPLNFVRCRLALESIQQNQFLIVDLDRGEPERMVIPGLRKEGYEVEVLVKEEAWLSMKVICGIN